MPQSLGRHAPAGLAAAQALSPRSRRRWARRLGFCYKRLRQSLRARRDALLFAFFEQELHLLHQAESRGELAVVYLDECRFSRQAPVSHAWQRRGQPAHPVPAERGPTGGYSLLGFWQARGCGQPFRGILYPGAFTAELVAAALDEFSLELTRPTVLVLDNASVHRAACVQARQAEWARRGLRLQFLPAYSPELNLIEQLWHRFKHYWLTPHDYQDEQTLYDRIVAIANAVGQTYQITFS